MDDLFMTPQQAWDALVNYRQKYYRKYIAAYSGNCQELNATGHRGTFWKRAGKCKIHVPLAADIAATSSDLLFSEEPRFTCYDEETEDNESDQQKRLDFLVKKNGIHSKLNEAAEDAACAGDVYLKLNWWQDKLEFPALTVVNGDSAWPEFLFGLLQCIHFFSVVRADYKTGKVIRAYERYERGKISMGLFSGNEYNLGTEMPEADLRRLGFEKVIITPVDDMLAVHIPNIKPNREFRDSHMGRSDFDGQRDLMDELDETYSSWMRDIRLAKARTIVPAEYLRRKPKDMFKEGEYTYEFDEDVETLVALDIDTQNGKSGNPITLSQFDIRAAEHAQTCADLICRIVTSAGYAPQTFGLNIEGMAQSGTALHIRENKSYKTSGKKQAYWTAALEEIMTAMVHLDAVLYSDAGSDIDDEVKVHFSESMASDISTMSAAVKMIHDAQAASIDTKVAMLHPDWTKKQISEEVQRIMDEQGMGMDNPDMGRGDYHTLHMNNPPRNNAGSENVQEEKGDEE